MQRNVPQTLKEVGPKPAWAGGADVVLVLVQLGLRVSRGHDGRGPRLALVSGGLLGKPIA